MKVHTNRRTNIGSDLTSISGLLLEAYVGGSTLISFECSSASASFPKVVTQACLRCLHIRGHMSCSNPVFFSSAFTKQMAVALAFSGAVWCSKSTSQPGEYDMSTATLELCYFSSRCKGDMGKSGALAETFRQKLPENSGRFVKTWWWLYVSIIYEINWNTVYTHDLLVW